uniref:Amiloride-sensitive sodium channel n=1 Tax=Parastrongyloides trichosuri TaxID=131310 RepID=A0A0N4ZBV4_PARTI
MPSKLNKLFRHVISPDDDDKNLNDRGDKRSQSARKSTSNLSLKPKNTIVGLKGAEHRRSVNSLHFGSAETDVRMATPADIDYIDFEMSKDISPSTDIPNNGIENNDSPSDDYTDGCDEPAVMAVLEGSNIDGIRHIRSTETPKVRIMWGCVITIFVFLAIFQIITQMRMYLNTPVATNIEALYPPKINFPTVAICNNNQYRLTYLTGPRLLNRKNNDENSQINSTDVFDRALHLAKDIDAVKFLRNAAHWKSRMILKCELPNGTRCRTSDFQAVWTLTGLCWAINTNPYNPIEITGAGNNNALKLLLNVERYERIENCNKKVRTESLPGLKILIYNQTDIPISSMDGVNVPPGYTMDIPFRMVHRVKIPGMNCIEESLEDKIKGKSMGDLSSIKACAIRRQMEDIEIICNCSMRRSYDPNPIQNVTFCNVEKYFKCVQPLVKKNFASGLAGKDCKASCEEIDYIAWQDMNELPNNIFPKLIEAEDEEDEQDIDDTESEDEFVTIEDSKGDEHFRCKENQYLDDGTVLRIKREAQRAYEKQTRYQEDIHLRTTRLIERFREATDVVSSLKWGWTAKNFEGVYERLSKNVDCYANMTSRHADIFNRIRDPNILSENVKTAALYRLLDAPSFLLNASKYKTITDLKRDYIEKVEDTLKKVNDYHEVISTISKIYTEDQYHFKLSNKLERMERIKELIHQYEDGKLQRRVWADKMQSRNMRHFFDEDLYESWYNIIIKDLDHTILNSINRIEYLSEKINNTWDSDENIEFGSVVLYGDSNDENKKILQDFINDVLPCTMVDVRNETLLLLSSYRKAMQNFQTAYTNLFKKELPEYLENFEFGDKFIKENFAQVNVFLHKMNIEYWKQESTYSIWSLACDVGGALGLFLGASLLTIIELIYLCVYYGMCKPKFWRNNKLINSTIDATKHRSNIIWKKSKRKIKNFQENNECSHCICCNARKDSLKEDEDNRKNSKIFKHFGSWFKTFNKNDDMFVNDKDFEFDVSGLTESQLRYKKEKNIDNTLIEPLLEKENLSEFQLSDEYYDDIFKNNKKLASEFAEMSGLNRPKEDKEILVKNEDSCEDESNNRNKISNPEKKASTESCFLESPQISLDNKKNNTYPRQRKLTYPVIENPPKIFENKRSVDSFDINTKDSTLPLANFDQLKVSSNASPFSDEISRESSNVPLLVLSPPQVHTSERDETTSKKNHKLSLTNKKPESSLYDENNGTFV